MDIQTTLCKWAENKYGLSGVTRVEFAVEDASGGGCTTCGYGSEPAHIEVAVLTTAGTRFFDEEYATDLINDILASA